MTVPFTVAVGDQASAVWANAVVNSILTPDTWNTVTFTNGWANLGVGNAPAGYYMDAMGFVHIRGVIVSGTANTAAFTLPVGSRPIYQNNLIAVNGSTSTGMLVRVTTAGAVIPTLSPAWVSMDGLSIFQGA